MNILVISLAGIGNTLLATPAIKLLRQRNPEARITVLVSKKVCSDVLTGSPYVDEVLIFEKSDIFKKLAEKLRFISMLRKRRFDASITVFPSNRIEYNLFQFLVGAKKRVTHKYQVGSFRTLAFLQNVRVPALFGMHDVEQNLRLLMPLGINPHDGEGNLIMWVTSADEAYAREFLHKNGIDEAEKVVGMHPGSATGGQIRKRWPAEKFAELGDVLCERYYARVLIFGGPEEAGLKQEAFTLMRKNPILVEGTLKQTAAIIGRCDLFIGNDSALMHIASAMKVPTVGILGPSEPTRTHPWGKEHVVVRKDKPCSPCFRYPFFTTNSRIKCGEAKCLAELSVEDISKVLLDKGMLTQ